MQFIPHAIPQHDTAHRSPSRRGVLLFFALAINALLLPALAPGALAADDPQPAQALPALGVDPQGVTVSGLSSGGYMATQMQTAFSASIQGAAIFAAGPYACARAGSDQASLITSLTHCLEMEKSPIPYQGPPETAPLVALTRTLAQQGAIDPLEGMARQRVYLFRGTADQTIPQPVISALDQWYQAFVPATAIVRSFDVNAAHGMITRDYGKDCAKTELPYINHCGVDGAGDALKALYGPLSEPAFDQPLDGAFFTIDQRRYQPQTSLSYTGLHTLAHLFVPSSCQGDRSPVGQGCRLHVAFHGCRQNQEAIGDAYWRHAGYNPWAAANRIVVLYPQTVASESSILNPYGLPNPKGCWDWWGFTGQDYLTKTGLQMRTVKAMIDTLQQR